jgi:hypothetical protein
MSPSDDQVRRDVALPWGPRGGQAEETLEPLGIPGRRGIAPGRGHDRNDRRVLLSRDGAKDVRVIASLKPESAMTRTTETMRALAMTTKPIDAWMPAVAESRLVRPRADVGRQLRVACANLAA